MHAHIHYKRTHKYPFSFCSAEGISSVRAIFYTSHVVFEQHLILFIATKVITYSVYIYTFYHITWPWLMACHSNIIFMCGQTFFWSPITFTPSLTCCFAQFLTVLFICVFSHSSFYRAVSTAKDMKIEFRFLFESQPVSVVYILLRNTLSTNTDNYW